MRISMVTCSGDILLRSYLRHRNVTERHSLVKAGRARTLMFFVLFCLLFFFQSRFEQGLK